MALPKTLQPPDGLVHTDTLQALNIRAGTPVTPAAGQLMVQDGMSPPPPADELSTYYPASYWLGPAETSGRGLRGRLTEIYRRLVLRDHLKFVGRIAAAQR